MSKSSATLTIRNVPLRVVRNLKSIAKRRHRSMEQEVRDLLEEYVCDLGLPNGRCQKFIRLAPKFACLRDELRCSQQKVRDDIRIDDGLHRLPDEIHFSTSAAEGRRAWASHEPSI